MADFKDENKFEGKFSTKGIYDVYGMYLFSALRDCRVCITEDGCGVKREGIFIPFLQNGIRVDKVHMTVFQYLRKMPYFRKISWAPVIPKAYRERMLDEVLLPKEYTSRPIGKDPCFFEMPQPKRRKK